MRGFLKPAKKHAGTEVTLNGAIYLAKWDFFKKKRDWYAGKTYAYVMDGRSSVDIDTLDDSARNFRDSIPRATGRDVSGGAGLADRHKRFWVPGSWVDPDS